MGDASASRRQPLSSVVVYLKVHERISYFDQDANSEQQGEVLASKRSDEVWTNANRMVHQEHLHMVPITWCTRNTYNAAI